MRCKCGATDDADFFPSVLKNGFGWCRKCHSNYYKQRVIEDREYFLKYARRRLRSTKDALRDEKKKQGCAKCGEKHPACLDFHHVNEADKKFNISLAVSRGKKGVDWLREEMAKCIVLCSNCHRKLHYDESLGKEAKAMFEQRGAVRYGNGKRKQKAVK